MEQVLNQTNELVIKVNSFYSPLMPTAGLLALGDGGIEFRATNGPGFIQIPWKNIVEVRAQVFLGGRYIRGFLITTDDGNALEFVASHSREALKVMREHLGSEKLVKNPSNFKKIFKRKK